MEKINIGTYAFGMQSPLDFRGKLLAAKDMGYTGIELLAQDFSANSVDDMKALFEETGLECVSLHAAEELIPDLLPRFAALGGKMIILPSFSFANKAEAGILAETLEKLADKAAPYGIRIGYHNHTTEFFEDEGKPILEYVIEGATPGKVWFQLDCGWATAAGIDCPAFIKKYSGRFCSIHIKENNKVVGTGEPRSHSAPRMRPPMQLGPDGKPVMTEEMKKMFESMRERTKIQCPMGDPSSLIDWKAIKAALDAQGVDGIAYTVERENDYLGDMTKCLAEDAAWLKANL